jgi:hypothetical protein
MDWVQTLINKFSDELEDVYQFNPPVGWKHLVISLIEYIHWHNQVHGTKIQIYSIEKKHGGLHFVIHHYPSGSRSTIQEEVFGAIHLAESLSCKICEVCGAPGTFTKSRMDETLVLGTYCNEHLPKETD